MGYPEVAKAFDEYDKFVSSGMLLWGTNVGKAAAQGELKQRGFQLVLDGSTTRASHSLFDVVINSAKAGTMEGKSELQAIKRIVGDRGYQNGLGTYINDAFDAAISEKEGIQFFNAPQFRAALGIGKEGGRLKNLFSNALPGPTVTKLKVWDPAQGIFREFDDAVYETGVNKSLKEILGEDLPEGFFRTEVRKLPTQKEFDDLSPKFMMRRAVMGSTRSAIRSFLPSTALGKGVMGKGAVEGATVIGIGPLMMSAAAFLVNYGGKVLTNPVSHRVLKNMVDANLDVMERDAKIVRKNKPHVLVNCKTNQGIDKVADHIIHDVFFDQPPKTITASVK